MPKCKLAGFKVRPGRQGETTRCRSSRGAVCSHDLSGRALGDDAARYQAAVGRGLLPEDTAGTTHRGPTRTVRHLTGTNYVECVRHESRKDFVRGLSICPEGIAQTHWRLRLIVQASLLREVQLTAIADECVERGANIIASRIVTAKAANRRGRRPGTLTSFLILHFAFRTCAFCITCVEIRTFSMSPSSRRTFLRAAGVSLALPLLDVHAACAR